MQSKCAKISLLFSIFDILTASMIFKTVDVRSNDRFINFFLNFTNNNDGSVTINNIYDLKDILTKEIVYNFSLVS